MGQQKYVCKHQFSNSLQHIKIFNYFILTYFADSADVENETVVFETNDRQRTLQCKLSGVPDTYTYSKWLHYTYSYKLVRTLNGQANGTLFLPNTDPDDLSNVDRGFYVCNVTNNITDDKGHLWQTGWINVIIKGKLDCFLIILKYMPCIIF